MITRSQLLLVAAMVVVALACSHKKAKRAEAAEAAETTAPPTAESEVVPVPTPAPVPEVAPESRQGRGVRKLTLTLRSTPAGATAAIDGRPVGKTPLVWELEADGRVHEFTFVLTGHAMERYKFQPVRDGVIHATMRPLTGAPDAGPP